MIPYRDNKTARDLPIVTYTLIALNVLIYLWDRNWNPFGPSVVFGDLGLIPREIIQALQGKSDQKALVGFFTSMFLHGNLLHIVMNMLFLLTFGENVERALGGPKFALYYLFWGILAAATHVYVLPDSTIPMVGASGAIGGVLGNYFLLFPSHRITFLVPPIFWPVEMAAWVMLGLWFLFQVLFPQQGVANWAHVGGFLAGMLTVLVGGGRGTILQGKEFLEDDE